MLSTSPANAWFTGFCQRHQIAVSGTIQQVLELAYTELAPPAADRAVSDEPMIVEIEYAQAHGWPAESLRRLESMAAAAKRRALARSTDAPSEPKGEHYDEVKATLTALHVFVESLCAPAIYRRLGPAASHARGFTHKITHALRHLDALATPPAGATSTPCASGEGDAVSAADMLRFADLIDPFTRKKAPDHLTSGCAARALRFAATQAPAAPATRPKGAGYFKHDAKRGWTQVNPADWILPGVVPLYFADGRTPTAGNTEDARSMGAVPAEVTAWVKAEGERIAAVHAYNAAHAAAKEHEFGRVDLSPHFQRMTETANAAHRLVEPMYAALTQAPSTRADNQTTTEKD